MNFLNDRALSKTAADLLEFDADSIRLMVSGSHGSSPDVWVADPDAYEKGGRVLRDSESPRLLAYSTQDHLLYASDGCNACMRQMRLPVQDLHQFAQENGIRLELLQKLVDLLGA